MVQSNFRIGRYPGADHRFVLAIGVVFRPVLPKGLGPEPLPAVVWSAIRKEPSAMPSTPSAFSDNSRNGDIGKLQPAHLPCSVPKLPASPATKRSLIAGGVGQCPGHVPILCPFGTENETDRSPQTFTANTNPAAIAARIPFRPPIFLKFTCL